MKSLSGMAPLALGAVGLVVCASCSTSSPHGGGVGDPCDDISDCQDGLYCGADGRCYDPGDGGTDGDADGDHDGGPLCRDDDHDGYFGETDDCPEGDDCNDADREVSPAAEEACFDLLDNDCDGEADEPPCLCARGAIRSCYSGDPDTLNQGLCHAGLQICGDDGTYGECQGEQLPLTGDACGNLIDDDCDGWADEDCDCDPGCRCDGTGASEDCECRPPVDQPCYSGPPSTGGAGTCHGGLRDCLAEDDDIYRWGECRGEVLPEEETCGDDMDQDCDGVEDDGCGPPPDGDDDGYSVAAGDCDDEDPARNPGATEACNGLDDNCDGLVDETCDCEVDDEQECYSGPTGTDENPPCAAGTQQCEGTEEFSHWTECDGEVVPELEVCDEEDNDCDGEVDERWALGSNGCGYCVFDEIECDGEDEDCDGLVDEGLINACGLCPPEPCFVEDYDDPGECDGVTGRDCDGVGAWEDGEDPTAVTLTQGTVRTPFLYLAVNSRAEVAQMRTDTGEKVWQVPSFGSRPSRTAVAWDYSVWVGNRCYDGDYNNVACSNAVHLAAEDGHLICRADVPGIARGVAIDADGYVWVGTWQTQMLYRIDGEAVDDTLDPPRCEIVDSFYVGVNVYGLAVDADGYVWTASNSGSVGAYTARVNTRDTSDIDYYANPWRYGIAVDYEGNVWHGGYSGGGPAHYFAPPDYARVDTSVYSPTGVAVDRDGNIWGSQYGSNQVVRINPADGSAYCSAAISCNDGSGYAGTCSNPHGVAVVEDGSIWVPIRFGGFVDVYDSECELQHVYPVDPGQELYTYSDMAGMALMTVTTRQGHWVQDFDSGYDDPYWTRVTWNADPLPAETSVEVTVVSAESDEELDTAPSDPCGPFSSVEGENEALLDACPWIQYQRWLRVDLLLATTTNEIRPVVRDVHVDWSY